MLDGAGETLRRLQQQVVARASSLMSVLPSSTSLVGTSSVQQLELPLPSSDWGSKQLLVDVCKELQKVNSHFQPIAYAERSVPQVTVQSTTSAAARINAPLTIAETTTAGGETGDTGNDSPRTQTGSKLSLIHI